eukprot:TRINITY_DN6260_c0_g1_i2.p1 TRINITY_DN6260_c0_g1~~TRINITY_DN6260_c0_g1_i2.p1  ORF type:complete len:341 (-),score=68.38 TRINITY_DN6260_c0_g1_i2:422-1444(-)
MMNKKVILCIFSLICLSHCNLLDDAKQVLASNWIGHSTLPAPKLYPHQWSWDSAFIAIGKSHYNQDQAQTELLSLFKSQWKNGMVPHIVFNPSVPDYFPGYQWWDVKNVSSNAPDGPYTSGIIQPPVHAIASLEIYKNAPNRNKAIQFLVQIYDGLRAWHDYLYEERQWDNGLIYLRHPWESGMDNTPLWDSPLKNIVLKPGMVPPYNRTDNKLVNNTDRPTQWTYDRYVWLVELNKNLSYSEEEIRMVQENNFLVVDVLFNSILVQANRDLAEIAIILGDFDSAERYRKLANMTSQGMVNSLWDSDLGTFVNFDMLTNAPIPSDSSMIAASFSPLFAGV